MTPTRIHRRGAVAISVLVMLPPAAAGCSAGGSPDASLEPPAPAAPVAATPVAPAETADPPTETADPSTEATDSAAGPDAVGAIFTESQADRGRTIFDETCSDCHTNSEFRGRLFRSNWGHRTVYAFYRTVRSTMPDDNPGGLEPQMYLDVVAYILSLNGHEAGDSELSADSPMREIRIDPDSEG
ncbi:MAG: hypothetical protein F4059_00705 [Gemmatimonadetes bacterium]|nr:hypothetical protein [Gemmatimonadota bacterium]